MPDLKIIYVAGYALKSNTGRNKATREKEAALQEIAGAGNLKLYFPSFSENRLVSYFYILVFDLQMLRKLLFLDKKTFVIERQTFLPLTNTYLYLRKIRIIYELHADLQNEISFYHKNNVEKTLLYLISRFERFNLGIASGIIYNHPSLQAAMQDKYSKPSICSYNGSNTMDFIIKNPSACRKKLHLDLSGKYFLFLGMISKWHGVDLLIEVFRQEIMNEYFLLLVGAGRDEYTRELKAQAIDHPNVIFKDYVGLQTAVDYINASDICLLPAKDIRTSPGSPLKLYDYIACGKPIIAQKDIQGYSDEVLNYNLGTVTDFNNPGAAAKDLSDFCKKADIKFYLTNNRIVAKTKVSWHNRMQLWADFLQTL